MKVGCLPTIKCDIRSKQMYVIKSDYNKMSDWRSGFQIVCRTATVVYRFGLYFACGTCLWSLEGYHRPTHSVITPWKHTPPHTHPTPTTHTHTHTPHTPPHTHTHPHTPPTQKTLHILWLVRNSLCCSSITLNWGHFKTPIRLTKEPWNYRSIWII